MTPEGERVKFNVRIKTEISSDSLRDFSSFIMFLVKVKTCLTRTIDWKFGKKSFTLDYGEPRRTDLARVEPTRASLHAEGVRYPS